MNRLLIATALVLSGVAAPAFAQECVPGSRPTEASCGNDFCACAMPCSQNAECVDECCSDGYCAPSCVCAGQGTVTLDCSVGFGCGSVAPTATPTSAGAPPMLWGLTLMGLGVVFAGRFARRGGLRSPAAVIALSVTLFGAAMVTARSFEQPQVPLTKSLKPVAGR